MQVLITLILILFPSENQIKINDPWIRPSLENMATALYFTIENSGSIADTLFEAYSDVAKKVEIHETYSEGDMMGMRKTNMLVVQGKSSFELKPGGYHIMLMKLKQDLSAGEEVKVILNFRRAGEINITAITKKPN